MGRNAWQALRHLEAAWDNEAVLVSFDFEKCFDRVSPRLALGNLERRGCPADLLKVVRWTWLEQRRWIQLGRYVHPDVQRVSESLPQGCPASPMALIALLLGPVATLQHRMGDSLCQSIFLDDRAAVVRTAEAAEDVIHFWTQAAGAMGLKENAAKLKVVTRCGQLRQELLDRGVDTSSEATVLGTVFREDGQTAIDAPRLDNFRALLQRLARLPVVSKLKRGLYRRIILPQLLWSFWWAPTSSEEVAKYRKLTSLVRKTLGLYSLLLGIYGFSSQAIGGLLFRDGRWGIAARDFLASWGFTQVRPHCWRHEAVGGFDLAAGGRAELKRAAHLVREAWRRARFQSFLQGTRHELADLTADFDSYEERWLKASTTAPRKSAM